MTAWFVTSLLLHLMQSTRSWPKPVRTGCGQRGNWMPTCRTIRMAWWLRTRSVQLGIVRLTRVLVAHGHPVSPPACTSCGRRVHLPRQGPDGRICAICSEAANPSECTRCGGSGRVAARFGAELLCRKCFRQDPRSHRECSKCGRSRPVEQRGEDDAPLCQACAPRRMHICVDCGRQRPAQVMTSVGPICASCYRQHRERRRCGRCDAIAIIAVRATGDEPDLCHTCWAAARNKQATERRSTVREQSAIDGDPEEATARYLLHV